MLLHIIRHGETDLNSESIIQGSGIDTHLNERGRNQARSFYTYYSDLSYDYIFSSALLRSIETVQPWIQKDIPTYRTSRLNEINWGIHEGKEVDSKMTRRYTTLVNEWYSGNLASRLQGGESAEELYNRLGEFINHIRNLKARKILICSHGRTIRALLTLLLDLEPDKMERFNHSNTGLFVVRGNGNMNELLLKNDTRHLLT